MNTSIRQFIVLVAITAAGLFAACGGCDDTAAGAPDGASCDTDADCAGTCNADGVCEGGGANGATNGTPNGGTNGTPNGATNGGTFPGFVDGTPCTADSDCAGTCSAEGVCENGGDAGVLPDGQPCTEDAECAGTCTADGVCDGGAAATNNTTFDTNEDGQVLCGSDPCECDDGVDSDGDGLVDGQDPECTGPYDNDEGSFATGIPGDNKDPKWQDCFFDGNSGAGDDGCRYHTDCLTGDLDPDDEDCSISQECFDYCRPRTPNGCDCFGCCAVDTEDGTEYVSIGSEGCETENLDACASCQQTEECLNECGRCELCYGRTIDDLPADCSEGGGMTGDPCTADADCQGICAGDNTCDGYGSGGFDGDPCQMDADCRGECGADSGFCQGFGSDTGFEGDPCMSNADCRDECTGEDVCSGSGGGSGGYVGDPCTDDTDCRGTCGGSDTCEGYGSGGYDGDACMSDGDCRGSCGADNTCTGSGSGSGSGLTCDDGETPCPNGQTDCGSEEYCSQGCCITVIG